MRVEIRGLTKRFGATLALAAVDVELAPHTSTALIGPNGSGKSTLTRVLMGMLEHEGTVRIDGQDAATSRSELAPRIAYVPQIAPRLAAPVREVVAAVATLRDLDHERVRAVCRDLDLDLTGVAARPFRALSGGMRQKLLIALALAGEPELLVLDEPTASLDPRARQRFFELVDGLTHRPTLLLCSHRLEEIRHLVDRVLVLEEGRVAYHGAAREFLNRLSGGAIEVLTRAEEAQRWLGQHGFHESLGGWWVRTAANRERLELLRELVARFGDRVEDLIVHDGERLELARGAR